jgi:hypothetical protein
MRTSILAIALSLLTSSIAAAQPSTSTSNSQRWPGKLALGLRPLGVQLALAENTFAIYKSNLDFAGRVLETPALSLWIGGELGVGGRENLALIEPGVFVRLTFEKAVPIPLVPFFQAGVSGLVWVIYGNNVSGTAGALEFKFAGGFDYYFVPKVAFGMQTTFAFGPGFSSSNNGTRVGFAGYWDLLAGIRIVL